VRHIKPRNPPWGIGSSSESTTRAIHWHRQRAPAPMIAKFYELHRGRGARACRRLAARRGLAARATRAELVACAKAGAAMHPKHALQLAELVTSPAKRAARVEVLG
jgi:hypothetical protein